MSADDTAAAIRACRGPAELERLLEAKTYTWADIREAHEAGRREGSETLISIVREYREMGDSWPKAIREVVAFQYQGLGCKLVEVGEAITHAGYKINGEQAVQDAWDKDHQAATA